MNNEIKRNRRNKVVIWFLELDWRLGKMALEFIKNLGKGKDVKLKKEFQGISSYFFLK